MARVPCLIVRGGPKGPKTASLLFLLLPLSFPPPVKYKQSSLGPDRAVPTQAETADGVTSKHLKCTSNIKVCTYQSTDLS